MIGVVIGSFGMPSAVALNVAAIHYFNNPSIPVLVHDDSTPPDRDPCGYFLRKHDGFELYRTPGQMGHVTGDIHCFIHGLKWAREKGLKYLVKISQRFIFIEQDWLLKAVKQADSEQAITLSQPAAHYGVWPWGKNSIRTECVLMRVEEWSRPEIFEAILSHHVTPELSIRIVAEMNVHPGKPIGRLRLFGPSKSERRQGLLWHDSNSPEEYQAIGKRLNVETEGYHNHGWVHVLGHQYRI